MIMYFYMSVYIVFCFIFAVCYYAYTHACNNELYGKLPSLVFCGARTPICALKFDRNQLFLSNQQFIVQEKRISM